MPTDRMVMREALGVTLTQLTVRNRQQARSTSYAVEAPHLRTAERYRSYMEAEAAWFLKVSIITAARDEARLGAGHHVVEQLMPELEQDGR